MAGRQVIIEVSPSRLEVAVIRASGGVQALRSERLDNLPLATDWSAALATLDTRLAAFIQELDADGASATVLYSGSATAVATISSCPVSTGRAAADRASALAMASMCSYPLEGNCQDSVLVASDRRSPGTAKDTPAPAIQHHTLAAADALEPATALAEWVRRAGLEPVRLVPVDAVANAAAIRTVADEPAQQQVTPIALLWIGEHSSVLATGSGGRIAFVRAVAVGTETFVDALTRPIRKRAASDLGEASTVTLDRARARAILESIGIPSADRAIDGLDGVDGASLLPALQPVLQRIGVEIKQSLRFGLPEAERAGLKLVVTGPGAAIAGLAPIIARQSGIPASEQRAVGSAGGGSSECGAIAASLSKGSTDVNLLPPHLARAITLRRVKQGMWAGVGVAMLFIAFDTVTTRMALSQERVRLTELRAQAERAADLAASHDLARAARRDVSLTEARVRSSLDAVADWSAVLEVVAARTPESVRLTAVELTSTDLGPRCRIKGFCLIESSTAPTVIIREFIRALEEIPIFQTASLGTTRRVETRLGEAQDFEVTIPVVALPSAAAPPRPGQATAATELTTP